MSCFGGWDEVGLGCGLITAFSTILDNLRGKREGDRIKELHFDARFTHDIFSPRLRSYRVKWPH